MSIQNKHVKLYNLEREMSKPKVKTRAKQMWINLRLQIGDIVYIYIEQETVSDLFIGQKFSFDRCTEEEFNDYFNEFIGIKPIPKKLPIHKNSGLRYNKNKY